MRIISDVGADNLNSPQSVLVKDPGGSFDGRILLMYIRFPFKCHSNCVVPGYRGQVQTVWLTYSDDDGCTWSKPQDITPQTKKLTDMRTAFTGIGVGIQLRRGPHRDRIIMPFAHRWESKLPNVRAIYSDDFGQTWQGGKYPGYHSAVPWQEKCRWSS